MKQLFTYLFLVISATIIAQAPQSIPYQAVVRNTDGSIMANASLTITFMIHDVTATGTVVYEENHTATTNTQGLISLNVGNGSVVSGTFSGINWGSGNKFLHVLMNAGSGVVDLGTQQMMSVPYALYAEKSSELVPTTTLQIGQNYEGGKIFYLDPSGKHGYVFAELPIFPEYRRFIGFNLFGGSIGLGKINSSIYRSNILPIYEQVYLDDAVIYCDTLNFNGYGDWFLPSSYELYEIISNNMQDFSNGYYISSTDEYADNGNGVDSYVIYSRVFVQRGIYEWQGGSQDFVKFTLLAGNCNPGNSCPYGKVVPIRKF